MLQWSCIAVKDMAVLMASHLFQSYVFFSAIQACKSASPNSRRKGPFDVVISNIEWQHYSRIEHQMLNIEHRMLNIEHRMLNIECKYRILSTLSNSNWELAGFLAAFARLAYTEKVYLLHARAPFQYTTSDQSVLRTCTGMHISEPLKLKNALTSSLSLCAIGLEPDKPGVPSTPHLPSI